MSKDITELTPLELRRRARKKEIAQETRGNRIIRAHRRTRILELRAAGLTEEQIAHTLGIRVATVSHHINKALKTWADQDGMNVETVRQMKLFELDQLKRAIWANAIKGELKYVREAVKIIQAQARIAGAEAPVKVERHTTVDVGIDHQEVQRMEEAWLHTGGSVIDGVVSEEINS
jgi:predicted transcriptional regulator